HLQPRATRTARHHAAHRLGLNGTLFHDDAKRVVGATATRRSPSSGSRRSPRAVPELYRRAHPALLRADDGAGTEAEWEAWTASSTGTTGSTASGCGLAEGAETLLTGWQQAGHSQSILSMYGHEELVPLVRGSASTGTSCGSKGAPAPRRLQAEHMVRHLGALDAVRAEGTVVIGDAADDAVAAHAVGARAVLYTGGTHSRGGWRRPGPWSATPSRRPSRWRTGVRTGVTAEDRAGAGRGSGTPVEGEFRYTWLGGRR
ncbi:HAD hydrolase-like protein, partial [Actinomadura keratinilytica]